MARQPKLLSVVAALLLATPTIAQSQPAFTHEYVGKIACGPQRDSTFQAVVRGFYGTVVNVRNPGAARVAIEKLVLWTLPPGNEQPVNPQRVATATLVPQAGFAAECNEVVKRLKLPPTAFREGFLVIRSSGPLDVVGFYTAGGLLGSPGFPAGGPVTSMHIERFIERPLR